MRPAPGSGRRFPVEHDPAHIFPVETVHLAATLALAAVLLLWVVQLAIYPLFGAVGREGFPSYHRLYAARISLVVGPLMPAEAVTAALLWLGGVRGTGFLVALGLLALAWISTLGVQVPLHRRLAAGYDERAGRWLVRTNWVRTLAWTARAVLVLGLRP